MIVTRGFTSSIITRGYASALKDYWKDIVRFSLNLMRKISFELER